MLRILDTQACRALHGEIFNGAGIKLCSAGHPDSKRGSSASFLEAPYPILAEFSQLSRWSQNFAHLIGRHQHGYWWSMKYSTDYDVGSISDAVRAYIVELQRMLNNRSITRQRYETLASTSRITVVKRAEILSNCTQYFRTAKEFKDFLEKNELVHDETMDLIKKAIKKGE